MILSNPIADKRKLLEIAPEGVEADVVVVPVGHNGEEQDVVHQFLQENQEAVLLKAVAVQEAYKKPNSQG